MYLRQCDPSKLCLIRSAALLVAADLRLRQKVRKKLLHKDLARLWHVALHKASAQNSTACLNNVSKELRLRVEDMRSKANQRLAEITRDYEKDVPEEEFVLKQKCSYVEIQSLQEEVSKNYTSCMVYVANSSMKILGDVPRSCKFALVGLGSLARKEITPYSDFECIIVLREGVQSDPKYEEILEYFRWLAVIFQIILISLGETIVPSVAIPSLNNFCIEGGDWFYDDITPHGISFDGFMPYASKSPLGRQPTENKPWKTELIKPVSEMLEYLSAEEDLKDGYHLADILTQTCFVCGDHAVFEEFQLGVKSKLQRTQYIDKLRQQVREDIDKFDASSSLVNSLISEHFNIKRNFYRSVTIFLSALGKYFQLESQSSFDIVTELRKMEKVSEQGEHDLKSAIATACEARLKVSAIKGRQTDVGLLNPFSILDGVDICGVVGKACVVHCIKTAGTLQSKVKEFFGSNLNQANSSFCFSPEIVDLENPENFTNSYPAILFCLGMYELCLQLLRDYLFELQPNEWSFDAIDLWSSFGLTLFLAEDFAKAKREFCDRVEKYVAKTVVRLRKRNSTCLRKKRDYIYNKCLELTAYFWSGAVLRLDQEKLGRYQPFLILEKVCKSPDKFFDLVAVSDMDQTSYHKQEKASTNFSSRQMHFFKCILNFYLALQDLRAEIQNVESRLATKRLRLS